VYCGSDQHAGRIPPRSTGRKSRSLDQTPPHNAVRNLLPSTSSGKITNSNKNNGSHLRGAHGCRYFVLLAKRTQQSNF